MPAPALGQADKAPAPDESETLQPPDIDLAEEIDLSGTPLVHSLQRRAEEVLGWLPDWAMSLTLLGAGVLIALVAHVFIYRLFNRITSERGLFWRSLVKRSRRPSRLALISIAMVIAAAAAPLGAIWRSVIAHGLVVAFISFVGWAALMAIHIFTVVYSRRFSLEAEDNLAARKHITQIRILRRVANVFVILLTLSAALMTFDGVRQYGVSLLAAGGAAGIVLGFALQPLLKNLAAGIQIAITQPIRIDDAVVVEGEWGRIEEITSTYVVVKIWDLRRLVLPITYFVDRPFQNWTREEAKLLGPVYLQVDYRTPLDVLRAKFEEIVNASPLWDGDVQVMQVTGASDQTMELRFLMSARNSGVAWDLRCEVREKLIRFLQEEHPDSLPRLRAELSPMLDGRGAQEAAGLGRARAAGEKAGS